nr:tRNA pseudouridine(38-40) synthase TruA [Ameyamaea chiangmaiensis]
MEYDGRDFVGWQRQITGLSVQQVLEDAATRLTGGVRVDSVTAGRTDTGVHATAQVAHLDFPAGFALRPHQIRDGLNFHMKPYPVVVLSAVPVPSDWSARFSAGRRSYLYRILNRPSRAGLDAGRVWHVKHPLDTDAMRTGAAHLLGRHDFSSFRATACQAKNPVRTLDTLEVTRTGEVIEVRTHARSFLHHQVRNMVGSLHLVGTGRWHPDRMAEALAACDRRAAGPTAPPDGLYLVGVRYDPDPFDREP